MRKPLLMALAAVLAATLWAATHESGDTVEAVKSSSASASPGRKGGVSQSTMSSSLEARPTASVAMRAASIPPALTLSQDIAAWKQREPIGLKTDGDLKAWGASLPPPPPMAPQVIKQVSAPPPPQAPRFPHAWVGRFNDMAVVAGPLSTWVVAEGQVIDGQWRIDQIQGQHMQLTYLPFKQAQTVAMQTP